LKNNGCHRIETFTSTCDSVIYDSSYGFTKELGTLPLNSLINSYIDSVNNFLDDVDNGKYIIVPFTNRENIKLVYDQFINDDFFKLQSSLIDNIIGDIQYIDSKLISLSVNEVDEIKNTMIIIVVGGIVLTIFIVAFILNKLFTNKIKEMNTFISFLFLVPPSIVNMGSLYLFRNYVEGAVYNSAEGTLYLDSNEVTYCIVNYGTIATLTNATFLDNNTIPAQLGDSVLAYGTLTDDNPM